MFPLDKITYSVSPLGGVSRSSKGYFVSPLGGVSRIDEGYSVSPVGGVSRSDEGGTNQFKLLAKALLFSLLFLFSTISFAQDDHIIEKPNPPRLVNNLSKEFPDFLSASEEQSLEQKLENFSKETSNQIVIVVLDDLGDYTAGDYAQRLGQKWGVGQKDFNNGLVILVKPTQSNGGRDVFIAPGYGLEGPIPDIACKRIIEDEIIPRFKTGNFYDALNASTDVLMKLAKGEINKKIYTEKKRDPNWLKGIIVIIIIIIVIINIFRKGGGGRTIGRGGFYGGFGGFGGGFGGGGGGFSSGGGGFGGFGGGGFGGGGAGGKW